MFARGTIRDYLRVCSLGARRKQRAQKPQGTKCVHNHSRPVANLAKSSPQTIAPRSFTEAEQNILSVQQFVSLDSSAGPPPPTHTQTLNDAPVRSALPHNYCMCWHQPTEASIVASTSCWHCHECGILYFDIPVARVVIFRVARNVRAQCFPGLSLLRRSIELVRNSQGRRWSLGFPLPLARRNRSDSY